MDASVILSEVASDTKAAHDVPTTATELSSFADSTLKKLSSRSPSEVALLLEMWQDVQNMRAKETTDEKIFTYQDAGFLLALPGNMAEEFVTSICVGHSYPQGALKMNELQKKQLKLQYDRMKSRKLPRNGAIHAEYIWKEITGWGKTDFKRMRLKDLASLMQLGDGPAAEIFRRLKIKAEYEEIRKDEKDAEGTKIQPPEAAASQDGVPPPKKYHKHARSRQAEPCGLSNLTMHDAPNSQNSAGNKTASSNDANNDKRKREADDEDEDETTQASRTNDASPAKKRRSGYEPWVGEWNCALCGYWNSPSWEYCLSKRSPRCDGRKDSHTAEVQLDDGNHRTYYNADEDPEVYAGDWQCRCGRWKPSFHKECKCGWCRNSSNRVMKPGPNNKPYRRDEYINHYNPAFA